MPISARQAATAVLMTLRQAGHEALFAGGAVRDLLRGEPPHDYDVATSARPEQVLDLFPHTVAVGAHFGVVVVRYGGHDVEVATFRSEGGYADGRHPTRVVYSSARQDVLRRDFTINGLLYDPVTDRVIDYVGGQADLEAGRLRCIGEPDARFAEDRLRMLRAVRFAVRFDLTVDPDTWAAVQAHASEIGAVSAERIRDELLKMLTGPRPALALVRLQESGLLAAILPEVEALRGVTQPEAFHPEGDVFEHTRRVLKHLVPPADAPPWRVEALFVAALLHDVGKPATWKKTDRVRFHGHAAVGADLADDITERLRLSRRQRTRVRALVADHARFLDVRKMRTATRLRFLRQEHLEDGLALHRADRLAGSGDLTDWQFCREELERLSEQQLRPAPLLDGHRLIALGAPRGPAVGRLLRALEDAQLEGQLTTVEAAEAWVSEALARQKEEP